MADFNIIIPVPTPQPPDYDRLTNVIVQEMCNPLTQTWDVHLVQPGGTLNLLDYYTGDAWKTLTVMSAASNGVDFELYRGGTPLSPQAPIDIDIQAISAGDAIPSLQVRAINLQPFVGIRQCNLTFEIKTVNDVYGAILNTSFQIHGTECTTVVNPVLSNIVSDTPSCGSEGDAKTFTITGEPNTTYRYQIATISNGNHGYTAELKDTDSLQLITPSIAGGTGVTVDGKYTTDGTGEINLRYEICAKPSRIAGEDNSVSVVFSLFEEDGITINTSQQISYNAVSTF